jgi:hypothetical protein
MLDRLFPMTPSEQIYREYQHYRWAMQPEPIWQFARERYQWAKDQWPNLSDRITTIWTLQDFGLLPLYDDDGNIIGTEPFNGRSEAQAEVETEQQGIDERST